MHSVCETHAFRRAAKAAGMSEEEIAELVRHIASNPHEGDVMPGTGGCRKLRWAAPGRGKRGGYRTITFFSGDDLPVFLITVFGKGERADLSKKEQNALAVITKEIVAGYAKRVSRMDTKP